MTPSLINKLLNFKWYVHAEPHTNKYLRPNHNDCSLSPISNNRDHAHHSPRGNKYLRPNGTRSLSPIVGRKDILLKLHMYQSIRPNHIHCFETIKGRRDAPFGCMSTRIPIPFEFIFKVFKFPYCAALETFLAVWYPKTRVLTRYGSIPVDVRGLICRCVRDIMHWSIWDGTVLGWFLLRVGITAHMRWTNWYFRQL